MKSKRLWIEILIMTLVFGIMLIGCQTEADESREPTYTVWTDSDTYAQFQTDFGTTLDDGYYRHSELTNTQFNQILPGLTNEYKHVWTKSQLNDWFVGRGFGNTEAKQETAWLITINHGFIASRSGSIVYMLVK